MSENIVKVFVKLLDSEYLSNDSVIINNTLIACNSSNILLYQYEIFHEFIIQNNKIYPNLCYVILEKNNIIEEKLFHNKGEIIKTNKVKIINMINIFENTSLSYHVIKHNIGLFKYVKCESQQLLQYVVQTEPKLILDINNPSTNLCKIAISLKPELILEIPEPEKEVILFALKTKPELLLKFQIIDQNIIKSLIQHDTNIIKYINNKLIINLLNTNIITSSNSVYLTPAHIEYLKISGNMEKLLKINGLLIEKIKEPTIEEINVAIQQNPICIQYLNDTNIIINILKEYPNCILNLHKNQFTNDEIIKHLVANIKNGKYDKEILHHIIKNDIKYINVIVISYGIEYLDFAYIYHKNILSGFPKITKDILLTAHKHCDPTIMLITPDRLSFDEFVNTITEQTNMFVPLLNKYIWNYYIDLDINIISKIFMENKNYFDNYVSFLINYKEIILQKYFELIKISPNLINLVLILSKKGNYNLLELIKKSVNTNKNCEKYACNITNDINLLQVITNDNETFYKYYSLELKSKLNTSQILKKNVVNIKYVPPNLITEEIINIVKSTLLYELYIYLPHNKLLHQEKLNMIKKDINLFKFMCETDRSYYGKDAVVIDGTQLKYIPMPDIDTCILALINTELAINYIPNVLQYFVMQKYRETSSYKLKNLGNKFKNLFNLLIK